MQITSKQREGGVVKRVLLAAMLALSMLALAACGGTVKTVLNMDSAESGSRTMTLTVERDSNTNGALKKTPEEIDAIIKSSVPAELEYRGMEVTDKNYVATFVLRFDSIEEYKRKVNALVGNGFVAEVNIENYDTTLLKGVVAEENFTSKQLLKWLPELLREQGVVESSNSSYVLQKDDGVTLNFQGKEYESDSPLDLTDGLKDYGFAQVVATVALQDDAKVSADVWYFEKEAPKGEKLKAIDSFFAENLPDGVTAESVDPNAVGSVLGYNLSWGRKATIEAENLEALQEKLVKALGATNASLTFEEPTLDSAGAVTRSFKADLGCQSICSPSGSGLTITVQTPESWQLLEGPSVNRSLDNTYYSKGAFSGVFDVTPKASKATATITTDALDKWSGSVALVFPEGTSSEVLELLKTERAKRDGVETSLDGTTLTFNIGTHDTETFTKTLRKVVPNASVSSQVQESDAFSEKRFVTVDVQLVSMSIRFDEGEVRVNLEGGASFTGGPLDGQSETSYESTDTSFRPVEELVTVPKIGGWIVLGVVLALLVALIVLAIVFRKRIAAWFDRTRANAAAAAEAREREAAVSGAGATAGVADTATVEPEPEYKWDEMNADGVDRDGVLVGPPLDAVRSMPSGVALIGAGSTSDEYWGEDRLN